jgi:hypothetical protein
MNAALVARSEAFWKSPAPPPEERARAGGMFGVRKAKKAARPAAVADRPAAIVKALLVV